MIASTLPASLRHGSNIYLFHNLLRSMGNEQDSVIIQGDPAHSNSRRKHIFGDSPQTSQPSQRQPSKPQQHQPQQHQPSQRQPSERQPSNVPSHNSRSYAGSRDQERPYQPSSYQQQQPSSYQPAPSSSYQQHQSSSYQPAPVFKSESRAKQSSHGNRSLVAQTPVQHIEHILQETTTFSEIPPAERYPTKISYFNAWSLPIQKYYLEQRGPYQPEEEEPVQQQERREMREFNTGILEEIMAQKMKEEMVSTQRNKRRQNLNMV